MEIILVLHNIRSTYNVGSILRTADGFGVKQVICSGYTPVPLPYSTMLPHLANKVTTQIHKTALGAETTLQSTLSNDIIGTLTGLRKAGYQIIGLENNIDEPNSHLLTEKNLNKLLQSKIVILLGEEVLGISRELYKLVDLFLEIPMYGKKESFNVSVATAILLFYLRYQSESL